jgi:hypothetical protein
VRSGASARNGVVQGSHFREIARERERRDKAGVERGDERSGGVREGESNRFDSDLDVVDFVLRVNPARARVSLESRTWWA